MKKVLQHHNVCYRMLALSCLLLLVCACSGLPLNADEQSRTLLKIYTCNRNDAWVNFGLGNKIVYDCNMFLLHVQFTDTVASAVGFLSSRITPRLFHFSIFVFLRD